MKRFMLHWHLARMLKEGFVAFVDDNALSRGAAIAFYAVTAIAPVLFVATGIAGLVLGPKAASDAVHYQLLKMMSAQSADLVQDAIVHARGIHHSIQGSLVGLIALIVTTSGVFTEMEDALNVIWKAPRHESYLFQLLRGRVLSLALVVMLGFLFMVSLVVAAGIGTVRSSRAETDAPRRGGTLNVMVSLDVKSLDPLFGNSGVDRKVFNLYAECLLFQDENGDGVGGTFRQAHLPVG